MEEEGRAAFAPLGVAAPDVRLARSIDLRYIGQFHEIELPVRVWPVTRQDLDEAAAAFHRRNHELYGFSHVGRGLEFLACRTTATVARAPVTIPAAAPGPEDPSPALKRHRPCFFGGEYVPTACFAGERLAAGNVVAGPAIIEESTTTVVIPTAFVCTVDAHRNYVLRRRR